MEFAFEISKEKQNNHARNASLLLWKSGSEEVRTDVIHNITFSFYKMSFSYNEMSQLNGVMVSMFAFQYSIELQVWGFESQPQQKKKSVVRRVHKYTAGWTGSKSGVVVCVELSCGLSVKALLGAAGILLLMRRSGFSSLL